MMRLAMFLAACALIGLPTLAQAQQCGGPCQKCADEMGYARDAQGKVMFPKTRASNNMAWERCLEEKRQAMRSGKH